MTAIVYFANQFADAKGHGMARYARELHGALILRRTLNITPVAGWSSLSAGPLEDLRRDTGLRLLPTGRRGTAWGWSFLRQPRAEWMLPGPVDVFHAVAMGYPVATGKPLVVTVHDLGPLTHPQYFSNNRPWLMRAALQQAVNHGAAIVCISQATAEEVRSLHGSAADDRLHVVHSGVSAPFFVDPGREALQGLVLPPNGVPFILTAGKISPRKNVQGVIASLKIAMQDIPHHLVVTGGDGWDMEQITALLDNETLRRRVHMVGYVSDEALRALYRRAAMYLHPSLYEGFGLTLLEAMAGGTPVITSNLSSLPEIAGDAALLVDPNNPEAIADAVLTLAQDADLASRLRQSGRARAEQFTWARTAKQMHAIYDRAAAG
ncbi:MAG: glycosyltransferase family 1 protein [Parvularcula sp.]|jgi:glycosyltransferase involved in cell wall biosynthesis|nr:glycosyltransferase family 1 protein [Parvularcula sp.]